MKKFFLFAVVAVMALAAVSCGSGKKKIDVKEESAKSLEKMMTAFESGDEEEFRKLQEQFGEMLSGLSEGDADGLLLAFKEFRSKIGGPIFDEKFNEFLWTYTLKADTNAELLTRLYDALEADRDGEDNEEILGVIGSAIDYAYSTPEAVPDQENFIARIDKWLKKKLISIGQILKNGGGEADAPLITTDGIGNIRIGDSINAISPSQKGLYDKIETEKETEYYEGGDEWVTEVLYAVKDGEKVLKIIPDEGKVWHVEIISPELRTKSGLGVGSTVEEIFAAGGKAYCGMEWWQFYDGILCDGCIFSGLSLSTKGLGKIGNLDDGDLIRLELSDLEKGSKPYKVTIPDKEWLKTIEGHVK